MCQFLKPTQELGQKGVKALRFGIAVAFKMYDLNRRYHRSL